MTCCRRSIRCALVLMAVVASQAQSAQLDRRAFTAKLVVAANDRAKHVVQYDGSYQKISYPGGDVAENKGACTDEIIRIYRALGIDLQKEVHEDIVRDKSAYPFKLKWMNRKPDANIDHRRVENLNVFFQRHGESLPITKNSQDYLPGDIVSWDLGGGTTHIGMVVDQRAFLVGPYKVLHNIGAGPQVENVLFSWKIIGHFRYFGPKAT